MWPQPFKQALFPPTFEIWHQSAQLCEWPGWETDDRVLLYCNDLKFSDRQVWANSTDPDQTAPRGAVWSGSTLFAIPAASFGCITLRKPSCSNFRVITANFLGVWIFKSLTVLSVHLVSLWLRWANNRAISKQQPSTDSLWALSSLAVWHHQRHREDTSWDNTNFLNCFHATFS